MSGLFFALPYSWTELRFLIVCLIGWATCQEKELNTTKIDMVSSKIQLGVFDTDCNRFTQLDSALSYAEKHRCVQA